MIRSLVCALLLGSTTLSAQQPALVGTWRLTYPAGMRIENGVPTPIISDGTLTVTAQGDSLIGSLVTDPIPDVPARPPARLAAPKPASDEAVFTARSEATLNMNGEERTATVVSTWRLAARGDSVSGTVERRIEGMEMGGGGPRPVTGTRARS